VLAASSHRDDQIDLIQLRRRVLRQVPSYIQALPVESSRPCGFAQTQERRGQVITAARSVRLVDLRSLRLVDPAESFEGPLLVVLRRGGIIDLHQADMPEFGDRAVDVAQDVHVVGIFSGQR
jgi:hypothetical protein